MHNKQFRNPLPLPDDEAKMLQAINALHDAGVRFTRPTKYQLKIGDQSFYPNKGTIFRDGDSKGLEERDLDAFMSLLVSSSSESQSRLHQNDEEDHLPTLRI